MEHGNGAGSIHERGNASATDRLARLAESQHGVFSRRQATSLGFTRGVIQRRIAGGRWVQLDRDVFKLPGTARSWHQAAMAACLRWGRGAALSHAAAAALRRVPGFARPRIELTVPRGRQRTPRGEIVHHSSTAFDVVHVEGIPVTTIPRMLLDLASALPKEQVQEALDDVLRRELITFGRLRRQVLGAVNHHRPGIRLMRTLLEERDPAWLTDNRFEARLFRVIRRAQLPLPQPQFQVRHQGRAVARPDFAYPDLKLAIEADGRASHTGRAQFLRDRARLNRLTLAGWRVIHVTWTDLNERPAWVTDQISQAIALVGQRMIRGSRSPR